MSKKSPNGPLSPIKRLSRKSWTYHHQRANVDSDFSSNASSYSPMQTLLVPAKTEETTFNDREGRRPPTGRLTLNSIPAKGKGGSQRSLSRERSPPPPGARTPNKSRAFHHEPYPPSAHDLKTAPDVSLLPSPSSHSLPSQPKTSFTDSRPFWLTLYFFFNLGLTLYNKGVLVRFPFPYTLTAIHALFGSLGGAVLARFQLFVRPKLKGNETTVLLAFSVLYSINIVVSNISLQLVTVPVSILSIPLCHN